MLNIILTSALVNLFYSIGAVVLLILTLRSLDKIAGFHFRVWLNDADDYAKAIYFGARIIAAAIIVGLVVSVPV